VLPTFFFARETKASVASANKAREFLAADGALRLLSAYDRVPDADSRTAFVELVETIARVRPIGMR
jgi:hypothetical protein